MPLVQTLEEMMQVVRRLHEAEEIVYDCETSGLDWRVNHIVGHVITFSPNPNDSFYCPVRHYGGGNIPGATVPDSETGWDGTDHPLEVELRRVGKIYRKYTGQNLPFDLRMLHRHGVQLYGRFEDTALNGALLDEYARSYSLENLCDTYGVQAKKGQPLYEHIARTLSVHYAPKAKPGTKGLAPVPDSKAMAHFWRTDARDFVVWDYAAGDGTSTWQLRDAQHPKLAEEGLLRVWDVECRLLPVLHRMSMRGIRIDLERVEVVKEILAGKLEEARRQLPDGFNVRGADVGQYILAQGVREEDVPRTPPSKRFPNGQMSFNEKFLSSIPQGKPIIQVRKIENLLNSFMGPLLERHMFKGRVHTQFNQLKGDDYGTITGRLSANDPNLQQVPKRNKELGPLFRSIFVPDEGLTWGSVDYSQCEPRLLAYYGRVRVLLDGYRAAETVDAHTAVATAAEIDRQSGKTLNQALLTGAGIPKIIEMLNHPNARQIVADYFAAMPEIKTLQKNASMAMRKRGYVKSLLGRRARLEDGRDYTAINRLLQCGNADVLKLKMVELDDYLESENRPLDILMNCHDANEFQFHEDVRPHYERCLQIMSNFGEGEAIQIDLPMEVDSGEGTDWGTASYQPVNPRVIRGTYLPPNELKSKKEAA